MLKELEPYQGESSGALWLSYHLLITENEWASFFELSELQSLRMYRSSGLFDREEIELSLSDFLKKWRGYFEAVALGTPINDALFRPFFSLYLTISDEAVRFKKVSGERGLIIQTTPCVIMQLHRFSISTESKVLSNIFGPDTIPWGVSLSFPQISQNQKTKKIVKTLLDESSQNRALWRAVQHFSRSHTAPLPIRYGEKKIWAPIRVGKECIELCTSGYPPLVNAPYRIDTDALSKIPK
ncbi:MAG: hypothetical protein QRY74_05570 [Chlamydia sp.]